MKPHMHLAIDVSWTNVETTWRDSGTRMGRHYPDVGLFEEIARIAERGLIDMIFAGDSSGIPNTWKGSIDDAVRYGVAFPRMDMSPWVAAMSRVTSHLGFGLTYATTFMHPFYIARLMNALDHLTSGRMAFNVITSQRKADAQNYGFDELMEHGQRYDRMDEFIDVCRALWGSVEPDAFEWNRETGLVANPAKVHPINHEGKFFKVKGPLSVTPSPQGHPVLIQAGGSPRGIRTAARFVDHIFGGRLPIPAMAKQRQDVDAALRAEGRDPEKVGIIWATPVIVAEAESEAKARKERLLERVPREAVGVWLSYNTGFDMATLPPRFSLRELNERIVAANASPVGFVGTLAQTYGQDGEITLDEFLDHGLKAATGYGAVMAGTAIQIADYLEERFEGAGSRGGFMIRHSQGDDIGMLQNIVDLLVPELQRRGRFRTAYTGGTLRENLSS